MARVAAASGLAAAILYGGMTFLQAGFQNRPDVRPNLRVATSTDGIAAVVDQEYSTETASSSWAGLALGLVCGLALGLGGADVASAGVSLGGAASVDKDPGMNGSPGGAFAGVEKYASVGNVRIPFDTVEIPASLEAKLMAQSPRPIAEGQKVYEAKCGVKLGNDGFAPSEKKVEAPIAPKK